VDYFDLHLGLSEEDSALKNAAHKFAEEVMRPAAKELDGMTAEAAVKNDSPLWTLMKKAYELGYHKALLPEAFDGLGLTPLQIHLVQEELAGGALVLRRLLRWLAFPSSLPGPRGMRNL